MTMTLQCELLAELRAALTEHDVQSEVCEDLGALAVEPGEGRPKVWVFVGMSSRFFSWKRADHQHPVNDIPGAARRIAEYARTPTESTP